MAQLPADRGDLLHGVAGLLEDERDVGALPVDAEDVAGGQRPVGVDGEPGAAGGLPHLADRLDVGLDRSTAHLDLQTWVALGDLLRGGAGDVVRLVDAEGVVGAHAIHRRAAQHLADADPVGLADQVVDRDVDRGFGVVVPVEEPVHRRGARPAGRSPACRSGSAPSAGAPRGRRGRVQAGRWVRPGRSPPSRRRRCPRRAPRLWSPAPRRRPRTSGSACRCTGKSIWYTCIPAMRTAPLH